MWTLYLLLWYYVLPLATPVSPDMDSFLGCSLNFSAGLRSSWGCCLDHRIATRMKKCMRSTWHIVREVHSVLSKWWLPCSCCERGHLTWIKRTRQIPGTQASRKQVWSCSASPFRFWKSPKRGLLCALYCPLQGPSQPRTALLSGSECWCFPSWSCEMTNRGNYPCKVKVLTSVHK